ncbi:hypothetical protein BCR34DRAFT_603050 [Clohesyomyces aquaticus]|uniref:Uncharacterized protein n=1 Tax=Clohesyomyces aquaticus TaxID=1231657 RepID=A0A1Y1ZFX3_9PLEO|nr:hypothetical protein BCR34DRAFT_603050 [Clohesyomyces aquaticus]
MDGLKSQILTELNLSKLSSTAQRTYFNYLEVCKSPKIFRGEYLNYYLDAIHYFSNTGSDSEFQTRRTIQTYIDSLQDQIIKFRNSKESKDVYKTLATDLALNIIGTRLALLVYFENHPSGGRPIEAAYRHRKKTATSGNASQSNHRDKDLLGCSIAELIGITGLVPSRRSCMDSLWEVTNLLNADDPRSRIMKLSLSNMGSKNLDGPGRLQFLSTSVNEIYAPLDLLESATIPAKDLNLYTLRKFAGVKIHWTNNVNRHMLLSKRLGRWVLECFAMPMLLGQKLPAGMEQKYMHEVQHTYPTLFRPLDPGKHVKGLNKLMQRKFWCWCKACSVRRVTLEAIEQLKKETAHTTQDENCCEKKVSLFDPTLESEVGSKSKDWNPEVYECLWSRIVTLYEFQNNAKPWSFWVLFRDRRDTVQFWTFLFAAFIIPLTIVQVAMGIAQVAGTFLPKSK